MADAHRSEIASVSQGVYKNESYKMSRGCDSRADGAHIQAGPLERIVNEYSLLTV